MTGLPDFEDEQFKSVKPKRPPVAQIINPRSHKGKMLPWGLAVTDKNAEDAGFTPPGGWETHDYLFKSAKEPEKVHFSTEPRLLIIYRTPLYLKLRETGEMIGEMKDYQKEFFDNRERYKVCSYSWGYILDDDNRNTNTNPILFALAGSSGATFNASWLQESTSGKNAKPRSGSCFDLEKIYHAARKQNYKPMGDLFHAHCIYRPIFEVGERGSGANTADVAVVERYHPPTIESLIPNGSEMSVLIGLSRESVQDWRPASIKKAAPSVVEDDGYSGRPKLVQKDTLYHGDYDMYPPEDEDYDPDPQSRPIVPVKPVVSNAPAFSANEELERTMLMGETGRLIQALGWTSEDGKNFLKRHFNKVGRGLLTTEELRQFFRMLEAEEAKLYSPA